MAHDTVFHQFMLYTPVPGTPLYEEHRKEGTLLVEDERPAADNHGQYRFNYRHGHIKDGKEPDFCAMRSPGTSRRTARALPG